MKKSMVGSLIAVMFLFTIWSCAADKTFTCEKFNVTASCINMFENDNSINSIIIKGTFTSQLDLNNVIDFENDNTSILVVAGNYFFSTDVADISSLKQTGRTGYMKCRDFDNVCMTMTWNKNEIKFTIRTILNKNIWDNVLCYIDSVGKINGTIDCGISISNYDKQIYMYWDKDITYSGKRQIIGSDTGEKWLISSKLMK